VREWDGDVVEVLVDRVERPRCDVVNTVEFGVACAADVGQATVHEQLAVVLAHLANAAR